MNPAIFGFRARQINNAGCDGELFAIVLSIQYVGIINMTWHTDSVERWGEEGEGWHTIFYENPYKWYWKYGTNKSYRKKKDLILSFDLFKVQYFYLCFKY